MLIALPVFAAVALLGILMEWRHAETERARANQAAASELQQRLLAESQELVARQNAYAADVGLAQRDWEADNWGRATKLVEAHIPQEGEKDLRGFEWRYLWTITRSDELATLVGHKRVVTCVAFSPDSRLLATGSWDGAVKIWDVPTRKVLHTLLGHSNAVWTVSFSPDGSTLASACSKSVWVWRTDSGAVVGPLPGASWQARFNATGDFLATGTPNGLALWNTRTWQIVNSLDGSQLGYFSWDVQGEKLAFAPDGNLIAMTKREGIQLWTVPRLTLAGMIEERLSYAKFIAFSPDGRKLVAPAGNYQIKVWDVSTKAELTILSGTL
jgi:WD40 repeat protein